MPRLGVGALVSRDVFLELGGDAENQPEFTMVRLTEGSTPDTLIAAERERVPRRRERHDVVHRHEAGRAAPARRGRDRTCAARSWSATRSCSWCSSMRSGSACARNRRDLAVLRVIGCTRRQLDAISTWQTAPFVVAALLVGIPLGLAVGRFAFTAFAQSLGVVDTVAISAPLVVVLVVVVLAGVALAATVRGSRRLGGSAPPSCCVSCDVADQGVACVTRRASRTQPVKAGTMVMGAATSGVTGLTDSMSRFQNSWLSFAAPIDPFLNPNLNDVAANEQAGAGTWTTCTPSR